MNFSLHVRIPAIRIIVIFGDFFFLRKNVSYEVGNTGRIIDENLTNL
jgi:hypothetical protein